MKHKTIVVRNRFERWIGAIWLFMTMHVLAMPVVESVALDSYSINAGTSVVVTVVAKSDAPVDWINKTLIGPNGKYLYGIGTPCEWIDLGGGKWKYTWRDDFSSYSPGGDYVYKVSCKNAAEEESEKYPDVVLQVVNDQKYAKPDVVSVSLSSYSINAGTSVVVTVVAKSDAPVDWINRTLIGPNGKYLYGIGTPCEWIDLGGGKWKYTWRDDFSSYSPGGDYVYKVSCKNAAEEESTYYSDVVLHVVDEVVHVPDGGPYTENVDGIEWTYVVKGGEARVGAWPYTAIPTSTVGVVVIPSTLGGCSVTSVGYQAFYECSELTEVTIPSSVTFVGCAAFHSCSRLTSVTIPSSVTSIGASAFWGCHGLTTVTIPSSVTTIDYDAFANCNGLKEFIVASANPSYKSLNGFLLSKDGTILVAGMNGDGVIPKGVTSIGNYAFCECSGLMTVTIPSSVTNIGECAFAGCIRLTTVTVPSSVTSIGDYAFQSCRGLTTVTIPSGVTHIGDHAFFECSGLVAMAIPSSVTSINGHVFADCRGLATVTIPSSVTNICHYAFENCRSLATVTIPSSVTSIGCNAFFDCRELTTVTIPSSVANIGREAFASCDALRKFTVVSENPSYKAGNELLLTKDGTTLVAGVNGDVVIPDGVTLVGDYAFSELIHLQSVTIPSSVTSIGRSAFWGCHWLTTVYVEEGDAERVRGLIEASGFDTADLKFESVDVEPTVRRVSFDANGGACSEAGRDVVDGAALGELTVPTRNGYDFLGWFTAAEGGEEVTAETVVTEDMTVYAHWRETDSVADGGPYMEIVDGIEWTYVVSNGEASVGTGSYHGTAVPVSFAGPLTIPATLGGCPVTGINSYAFESCSGLTSVTIPPDVTSIGDYAFYYCYGLQSVSIPSSVKSIGREAFRSCWGLTSVVIPSGVTSIGEWAFEYCDRLTSVTIPSGVTSIGRGAFGGCNSLTELIVDSGNLVYASVDGVLYDKTKGDLIQCPGGKEGEMSISADVTSIGASAFQDCRELTSVTIPSSVTNIGHLAFRGCDGLTSVRMPASVTCIDEGSFADCSNLMVLEVDSANKFYASFDGILCNKAKTEVIQCPAGKSGEVTIPVSVTNIWGHAFSGCSRLTSVTIPEDVTYIGVNAFTGCRGLTSVTIPSSVTSLSFGVFESCSGLTSVVIPQGVTAIGCFAFAYCSELTSVVIPSSVTRVYDYAFGGCNALKTVYVAEGDAGRVRGMIDASGFDTSDLKFETVDPEPTVWKVSFDANGGACSGVTRDVADGAALGELPVPTRNGYQFLGWFTAAEGGQKVTVETVVESDATWYAHWTPIQYDIVYSGLRGASNPNPTSYTIEDEVVFAALPDIDGWTFSGWSIAGIAVGNTGDITVRANWEKNSPSIDPGEDDEPMDVSIANTYDGVIVDADGLPMGYINVKAAKASGKGAARACTVTATIQMVGEAKKVTVKGKVPVDEAAMVAAAKDGRILDLNFSKYGIWGTFDDYAVEGVRNLLQSTAKSDDGTAAKRAAEIAFARFKGTYVLAYGDEYGYNGLSLNVMAKGAVKVSGKLANGVSVSTTSQLIVGEDYSVIPVIYTKGDSALAFNVYFANDGTDTFVFGYYDAVLAPVGALSSGLSFYTGEAISEMFDDEYTLLDEFLPNDVSVEPSGNKWIVAGGAAAGKIKVVDGEVVDTKESANPSGLKLTFNTKAGTFSGSFKVYAMDAKDKLKTFTATVNGVVVDGCGYGTATVKGRGSCAIVIGE